MGRPGRDAQNVDDVVSEHTRMEADKAQKEVEKDEKVTTEKRNKKLVELNKKVQREILSRARKTKKGKGFDDQLKKHEEEMEKIKGKKTQNDGELKAIEENITKLEGLIRDNGGVVEVPSTAEVEAYLSSAEPSESAEPSSAEPSTGESSATESSIENEDHATQVEEPPEKRGSKKRKVGILVEILERMVRQCS